MLLKINSKLELVHLKDILDKIVTVCLPFKHVEKTTTIEPCDVLHVMAAEQRHELSFMKNATLEKKRCLPELKALT